KDKLRLGEKSEFPHAKPLEAGDEINLSAAILDQKAHLWADGKKLGEIPIPGNPDVMFFRLSPPVEGQEQVQLRDTQWVDLSGMTDEAALGFVSKLPPSSPKKPVPDAPPVWIPLKAANLTSPPDYLPDPD